MPKLSYHIMTFWRHLRKGTLLRNKYRRPWSDASHDARRLIRAYDICRSWKSIEIILCRSLCSVIKNYYCKNVKTADLGLYCLFRNKAPFRKWRHKHCKQYWTKVRSHIELCGTWSWPQPVSLSSNIPSNKILLKIDFY